MSGTTIQRVARVEASLVPHRWDWADAQREAIAAHWARRCAERSGLFDGRVLMVAGYETADDALRVRFFETGYANLLAWIEFGFPDASVANGFAMGALRAADGAYLLGVMGAHTANAGQVYFPAGTPDLDDVASDGRIDLEASALRELEEETGLAREDVAVEPGWVVARHRGLLAFLKPLAAQEPGDRLAARIQAHLDAEDEPELAGIRIVRGPADIEATRMPGFLPDFLLWSFAGGSVQR